MWKPDVGFVDAIVLCTSNLQQGSNVSGVVTQVWECKGKNKVAELRERYIVIITVIISFMQGIYTYIL